MAIFWLISLQLLESSAAFAATAAPNDQLWILDTGRSRAGFQIRAMWMFNVGGQFGAVSGNVRIDAFRNTATVDARIDANAVSMRNAEYAAWVKSREFFDVQHYPQIHFVSDPIPLPRLRTGGELRGTLELRGVTQPVIFQLKPNECQGRLAHDCPVRAEGTVLRSVFGMTSRRVTLSDKVDLDFTIFVNEAEPATDAPAQ
ncbi:YceI family protein [Pseudolysobacter antarcticus]|uniref:YceI family protein n=1 Tax=Pseudolysobacter antarcticus TaxID=2511995 RepID=UPI0013EBE01A|nr:YceI family protein [Pseudolysobacter antarcticus]